MLVSLSAGWSEGGKKHNVTAKYLHGNYGSMSDSFNVTLGYTEGVMPEAFFSVFSDQTNLRESSLWLGTWWRTVPA